MAIKVEFLENDKHLPIRIDLEGEPILFTKESAIEFKNKLQLAIDKMIKHESIIATDHKCELSNFMEKSLTDWHEKEDALTDKYLSSLVTKSDYKEAVVDFGFCLSIVPTEIKTHKFILDIINDPEATINLDQIPLELITYELCLKVVSAEGFSLRDVPDKYKDFDLCLVAVKQEVQAIIHVPKEIENAVFQASFSMK
jgi:hypothetical protein